MGWALFEVVDSSDQQVDELRLELSRVKEVQVTDHTMISSTNKRTLGLEK